MSKSTYKSYIKIVIFLGIIAYIIMFTYTFFVQDIDTFALQSGVVEEKTAVDGVITRTEEIVTLNVKDKISPLVSSGERVSKGQVLATIENDTVKMIQENISKLNEEVGSITAPNSFNSDIKTLDNKINNTVNKIIKSKGYKSTETLSSYKDELNQDLQNKIYKISEIDLSNEDVKKYVLKMNEYKNDLKKIQTTIKSLIAGTVVYKLDGYEKILTAKKIPSYTSQILNDIPRGELVGTSKENSFKIVDNLECYITVVLYLEESKNAYVDQKVSLRFPEIDNTLEVNATIDYINSASGENVITFKINKGIEKIINYRKTKVEIIWDSEEGYKVPKNAIVQADGKSKIYLYLSRNYVVEKYVEIKKEYDDYAIIEGAEGDKLYLYDSVILNASNINLNKMLKY